MKRIWPLCLLAVLLAFCKENNAQKPVPANKKPGVEKLLDSVQLIHDFAFLASEKLEGRETATPGNKMAQDYIVNRFDSLRLPQLNKIRWQPFPVAKTGKTGNNIIAFIPGSQYRQQYYVISAHYDHVGKQGDKIYPGADDNASGAACLLAMAAYFKKYPPKHSLLLAAFDAEEKGLLGSTFFVDHAPVDLKNIVLNVNMDMVSRNDHNEIYVCGTFLYPFLKKYITTIQQVTPVQLIMGHDESSLGSHENWTNQSDHFPFHKKNIPFLYFGVEDHPDYHKPGDTFDKVNKSFYYRVCTMITETVLLLDKQDKNELMK